MEYIHSHNIIHCDIKPENIISDNEGYVRVTDFGLAKINDKTNLKEINVTAATGYTAPEVLCAQSYSFPVDYYAIGAVCYECMFGSTPYTGKTRKELKQAILHKQANVTKEMLPHAWSSLSMDFVNKCIQRKEIKRLGYQQGISELKEHPWFSDIEWTRLYNKTIQPPFTITSEHNYDKKHCESVEVLSPDTNERYNLYMQKDNYNSLFVNYTYLDNLYVYNSYTNNNQYNDMKSCFSARGTRITFVKEVNELKDTVKDNQVKCNMITTIKKYENGLNVKKGLFNLGMGYLNKKYLNVGMLNRKGGLHMNNRIIPYHVKPSCDNDNEIKNDLPNINMNVYGSLSGKNNFYRVVDTKRIASLKKNKANSSNSSINNESMILSENRTLNQTKRDYLIKKIKNSHSLSGMIHHSQNISYC